MAVIATSLKITGKDWTEEPVKTEFYTKKKKKQCPSLQELEKQAYPFSDSDIIGILDDLLDMN